MADQFKIPACGNLERLVDLVDGIDGVYIKNLQPGTVLQLVAKDGPILRMVIIDPLSSEVELKIEGSKNVDGEYHGIVGGSSFGGCMIKIGWIGVGTRLEFHPRDGRLPIWSWIKSISFVSFVEGSHCVN